MWVFLVAMMSLAILGLPGCQQEEEPPIKEALEEAGDKIEESTDDTELEALEEAGDDIEEKTDEM